MKTPQNKPPSGGHLANCYASFVRMFKPQFAGLVERGEKMQTVRPAPKRMPKPGDKISLRAWSDKPYRSKQKQLAEGVITRVVPITITAEAVLIRPTPQLTVHVPREQFAVADGFSCWDEMRQWFERQHRLPFDGVLISWQNADVDLPDTAAQGSASKSNNPAVSG